MNRVATVPLQRNMSGAIQSAQQKLAITQTQLATGKKAQDLAALGTEAVRNISARTMVARQEAHATVATRLGTTLAIYDANISTLDTLGSSLRVEMLNTIGTGNSSGLQDAIEAAFDQYRAALNGSEAGVPIFSGSQMEAPFKLKTLGEAATADPADAFANDNVRASARVGDNLDLEYGVTASELGSSMLSAFRTLAQAGEIGEKPTEAQTEALNTGLAQLDTALKDIRTINAANGRRQAQLETLTTRAEERTLLLNDIISRNEDADLGQVAMDLAQQKTVLQASYSVFAQLTDLSLANYLR